MNFITSPTESEKGGMNFITSPTEIEKRSFEIITGRLAGREFDPRNINIIKRVIHTTADFDYADNLYFSDGAVSIAIEVLKNGAQIVTDTQMARAGINKRAIAQLGCGEADVHCFIDASEVHEAAQATGSTRARAAVDHAAKSLKGPLIFAIGNAPTALIRISELVSENVFSPALIIAVPVGFVNVVESKGLVLGLKIPHIVARGQKGGSNVAAAICNALLYEATERTLT